MAALRKGSSFGQGLGLWSQFDPLRGVGTAVNAVLVEGIEIK